ncbi:hypothetical protein LZZ90_12695 [Flavobacterium sp. SM15]|uniref:hypothetical protein n=1 Tax=Flavobacterium sp. SM15 TaxID=2908005 RepID=UPI001EDC12A8|nr:hypothetical protein [Flavobacterium sp. SM15]MCG2612366.1 hypothetical protein [Flavobacterium sp. SM15]
MPKPKQSSSQKTMPLPKLLHFADKDQNRHFPTLISKIIHFPTKSARCLLFNFERKITKTQSEVKPYLSRT